VIFGTGEHATADWGFIYGTRHFVLLPFSVPAAFLAAL
jgi:hypothetical protein